jgi:uncharacterized phage protein gp47/JayE
MQLSLQTFSTLVQNMAASVQSAASQAFDVTVGSVVRAILEANASVALWMQWLILQVLQSTRAATSNGADLDTWMADFTLTRLPAVAATGNVTFSRYTATMPALVPSRVVWKFGGASPTQRDIRSGSQVNASRSELLGKRLPAVHLAHRDLP